MTPYSNDLRARIVEAYENKEGSIRKLAKRFAVSASSVERFIKLYRKNGNVDPKPHGGGQSLKIDEDGLERLHDLVAETSDATVTELHQQYELFADTSVSRATVGRALLRIKLTIKKNNTCNRARHGEGQTASSRVPSRGSHHLR